MEIILRFQPGSNTAVGLRKRCERVFIDGHVAERAVIRDGAQNQCNKRHCKLFQLMFPLHQSLDGDGASDYRKQHNKFVELEWPAQAVKARKMRQ